MLRRALLKIRRVFQPPSLKRDELPADESIEPVAAFVHVPRTGGSSLNQAIMHMPILQFNHNRRPGQNYRSFQDYRASGGQSLPAFAFVRNPYDRVVSSFFYLQAGGLSAADEADGNRFVRPFQGDFKKFCLMMLTKPETLEQIHFRPQWMWLCDESEALLVNMVGRFETMGADWKRISKALGLPEVSLPHINSSQHDDYRKYYCKESMQIVSDVYARDFKIFNYHVKTWGDNSL